MFLDLIRRRNPAFVEAVFALHQAGELPSGAFAIDLDAVEANARALAGEARRLGLEIFAMTKQVGRNPAFIAAAARGGIDACVAVDTADARAVVAAGSRLAHVGHLVQVPFAEVAAIEALRPANWTVYALERAVTAAAQAARAGRTQEFLARICGPGDVFYRTQEGGFPADDVLGVAEDIDALDGARFAGVTTFPALLFDHETRAVRATPNLVTLERAAQRLAAAGLLPRVNGPGTTSCAVMGILADHGVTQVEPGHGLTGTTALHVFEDLVEVPAVCYVAEISHHHAGEAYATGGGFYVDPIFPDYQVRALVGRDAAQATLVDAELQSPAGIDYHAMLQQPRPLAIGETTIFGFRPQIFVTRALVAPVAGVGGGRPRVAGIWAADGSEVAWP